MTDLSPSPLPRVLAIHGSASCGRMWHPLTKQLRARAQVLAPDLPGYGTARADGTDRLHHLSECIADAGDKLHLVAHSFGGAVALKLANIWPERIRSVVLYDPIVISQYRDGRHGPPSPLASLWETARQGTDVDLVKSFTDFWVGPGTWDGLSQAQRDRLFADLPGLQRDMTEVSSGVWSAVAPGYRGPLTVLRGGRSPNVTQKMCNRLIAARPHTREIILPAFDHLAPLTAPEAIAEVIDDCLARADQRLRPTPHPQEPLETP